MTMHFSVTDNYASVVRTLSRSHMRDAPQTGSVVRIRHAYLARTSNIFACCHSVKLCALPARDP